MGLVKFWMVCLTIGLVASWAQANPLLYGQKLSPEKRHYAVRRGKVIHLRPDDFTFEIPEAWVQRSKKSRDNLYLSRARINSARIVFECWDDPFARVLNTVFPFEQCAVIAGGEPWGRQGTSTSDLQMRAYIGNWTPEQIHSALEEGIQASSATSYYGECNSIIFAGDGFWTCDILNFEMWKPIQTHKDRMYARMDVYFRTFGKQTVVLVFMTKDGLNEEEIKAIVHSFRGLH